ncbi:hypothetical protein CAEBREN_15325 [Caenorhabditis brenneri]|uniref:ETS domain-containing protein n=1 Tax=Caenorhabditis brenneri TaxID=135651 RepID=G0NEX9_CAEBE|nr:hypothetical protein CAEBREN_15325 [Caenorhabditis brenneri]
MSFIQKFNSTLISFIDYTPVYHTTYHSSKTIPFACLFSHPMILTINTINEMAPRSASQSVGSLETFVKKVNLKSVKSPKLPKVNILDFIRDTIESGEHSEVITWVDQNKSGSQIVDPMAVVELYNKATGKRYTKFDNFCRPLRRLAEEGVLFKPKTMRSTWYFVETVMAAALAEVAMEPTEEELETALVGVAEMEEAKEDVKVEELIPEHPVSLLDMLLMNCEMPLQ